jgi:hypothetical protein
MTRALLLGAVTVWGLWCAVLVLCGLLGAVWDAARDARRR